VRLTMGGEPTFVSATDQEGVEWNIDALGPTKRQYAGRLIRKLTPLWSKGAALTYNMGKHYPGEQLPRWAIHAHWRTDGEPVWRDPALLASDDDKDTAAADDAAKFAGALAERLQIDPGLVNPAYEDIHYYLWREKRLPANVVAMDSKLRDELERARLAKVFGHGLAAPVGSVLPLRRVVEDGARRWQSSKWFFKDDVMFLVPGDSPVGLRLPLESLPWADPEHLEVEFETDPFAPREKLPARDSLQRTRTGDTREGPDGSAIEGFGPVPQDAPVVGREAPGLVRTALAVEARDGILHVFYPPLYEVSDWLELTAAVEDTAQEFGRKVVLEGYLPPEDARVINFSVTPDPGVIETNIHPANNWGEIVERTTQLYEVAREVGLATEKFMLDGRHVGTGGGNHVVMGGASPEDSPFLRRPDLLKSMLGFWHNHPSLSFLFSGLFVGPTSQAPRVDEARNDQVYELEVAFKQIPESGQCPPWLVDRIFRNVLVDCTGNTHRAEFCIDKLYAPESSSGRLGLLEMRAFEMPPHSQMSLTQHLLLRALIASFWKQPYNRKLVNWRTEIHDKFMLPHFVKQDFDDVLDDLNRAGFPIHSDWFAPHLEFRFPQFGTIEQRGVQLELRQAIEPWNVLGEEPAGGGTVRYVDSSVERLQVLVNGMTDTRHVVSVNRTRLPLHPTGTNGQFVAGVRYRAWQPPSCLHPTIGVHAPLVFDIIDTWSDRSIGGCTYHVAHPGGRNFERFPVNAYEAEGRRISRFFKFGHTPGPLHPAEIPISREFPLTLDLRRQ